MKEKGGWKTIPLKLKNTSELHAIFVLLDFKEGTATNIFREEGKIKKGDFFKLCKWGDLLKKGVCLKKGES